MLAQLAPSLKPYGVDLTAVEIKSIELERNARDAGIARRARQYGGKVIIIGSDAFDWEIFKQVSAKHRLPNIERMIREGASGDLISVEPLISPMIWTTMATGVEPQVHGIIDFVVHDETTGEDIPITSDMRRVPAIWNIATRFGLSAGFVGWLGSYPAEPVTGFIVSDRIVYHVFDPRWQKGEAQSEVEDIEGLVYPPDLLPEIKPLVRGPEDISYEELSQYVRISRAEAATEGSTFDRLDPIRNLKLVIAANTTHERIARRAYEKFRPRVFGVYLDMVDTMCHLFIKYMAPPMPDVSKEDISKYEDAVAAAYVHTDSLIGEWLKIMDDSTTLILISDHGFKSGEIRPSGPSAIGAGQPVKWHRLAGAIALYGNHVKPGVRLTDASVFDVCPTVLRLLGLPPADDMPGRVLEEALEDDWLKQSSEVGTIESYGTRMSQGKPTRRSEEEAAILERLKALGYIGRGSTGLKRMASGHFARGEFDKAIEIWEEVLRQEPGNVEIMTAIANAHIHKGEPDRAIAILEDAIAR
ncbi:MAG TPA: tetratricopeptide repeat protein, partial [Firmicutes bacterium]|nr:tetratricopeptide repeat protein [Bacillota bacterium]